MNRLIGIASAMFLALLFIVPVAVAAGPSVPGERVIFTSGADITLPAGQSVDLFIVYNGHARIEGHANTIFVVNGSAELIGARANGIVAIRSQIAIDGASVVSGDVRSYESTVMGATSTTVTGRTREFGPDMLLNWRNLGAVLLLVYVAFAVSALVAGVILAGLAGRQVRAASSLITGEPAMVVGAAVMGLMGILVAGIAAIVTVVGIPFGVGLLALVLPAMFVVGYIVAGIAIGELIVGRSSPVIRERPYLAAIVGLSLVGLVSIIPPIGGLISFVGFGAVVLLTWRVARGGPERVRSGAGQPQVAETAA